MKNKGMRIKKTNRGFRVGEFKDENGEVCSIQESSVATDYLLWLGCDKGTHHLGTCLARMHIDRKRARQLSRILFHFAVRGRLPK